MATTYRGFDVVEIEPDRGSGTPDEIQRKVFVMDSTTGARTAVAADPAPTDVRTFRWLAFNRTEAKDLRDFLDARKGRAIPCWIPAWEEDMTLAADQSPGATSFPVLFMQYTALMFPNTNARRHLAIRVPGGTFYYRKVSGAVDNGNGTETVTIESAIPVAMPANGTLICFLHFARLDDDVNEIEWVGQYAECEVPVRDLPTEVPA